ncbi:MAG TPA: hypothetical protein VMY78_07210 [Solirubrobacteraceae bacterium]|nr:hypothetical protein [Solirubrobacteraceae bacterium]
MTLWLLLTLVAVWTGVCVMAVALCAAAARGDREDAARWAGVRRDAMADQNRLRPARLRVVR